MDQGSSCRGLAAAGLANDAQGLPLPDVERDVGHRVDHTVATDWEFLDKVLHPEDDVLAAAELDGAATSHQVCSPGPSVTAPIGTPDWWISNPVAVWPRAALDARAVSAAGVPTGV